VHSLDRLVTGSFFLMGFNVSERELFEPRRSHRVFAFILDSMLSWGFNSLRVGLASGNEMQTSLSSGGFVLLTEDEQGEEVEEEEEKVDEVAGAAGVADGVVVVAVVVVAVEVIEFDVVEEARGMKDDDDGVVAATNVLAGERWEEAFALVVVIVAEYRADCVLPLKGLFVEATAAAAAFVKPMLL
jgi:hypothetical protein